LVVDISSDRIVPSYLTAELLKGLPHVREVRVETDAGHSAILAPPQSSDHAAIWRAVATFVDDEDG
jgi:homoserine acetyltransferase